MVTTYADIQARRFGRDLVLPAPGDAVTPTPTGDWPTVAGRPNLQAALIRRATTSPGELMHRPQYGAGVLAFLESPNADEVRARMDVVVRANLLQDPRVADVQTRSFPRPENPAHTVLDVRYQARGDDEVDEVSTVIEV